MRVGVPTLVLLAMSALATPSFGQLSITSFQPSEISYIGQTPYTLTGSGFTPGVTSGMVVRIDGVATTLTSVTSTQITGFAPSHAVTIDPVDVTVVATDVDGTKEIVRNGKNGFLVPPKNAVVLADAIDRALVMRPIDPDDEIKIRAWDANKMVRDQEALYERALRC